MKRFSLKVSHIGKIKPQIPKKALHPRLEIDPVGVSIILGAIVIYTIVSGFKPPSNPPCMYNLHNRPNRPNH